MSSSVNGTALLPPYFKQRYARVGGGGEASPCATRTPAHTHNAKGELCAGRFSAFSEGPPQPLRAPIDVAFWGINNTERRTKLLSTGLGGPRL